MEYLEKKLSRRAEGKKSFVTAHMEKNCHSPPLKKKWSQYTCEKKKKKLSQAPMKKKMSQLTPANRRRSHSWLFLV